MRAKSTIESVCQCRLFAKGVMIMVRQLGYRFRGVRLVAALGGLIVLLSGWLSGPALAASAKEIDVGVDGAIVLFEKEVKNGKSFLQSSKGVLAFPRVLKGGAGFGGEYGQGALRIGGKTVDYYSTLQGSFGLQLGGEIKTVFVVFLDEGALKRFREGEGWKAGVDGSVSLVTLGAGGSIDTNNLKDPIVGFVLGQKGLMYNLSFEGTKFTKLDMH
jgi:lipid-binding SYLF domain-containing protein